MAPNDPDDLETGGGVERQHVFILGNNFRRCALPSAE